MKIVFAKAFAQSVCGYCQASTAAPRISTACFARLGPTFAGSTDRTRGGQRAEVLVIEHPPAEDAELEQRDRDDDEDEDEGHRRTKADPVHRGALEERVEDQERHSARRIQR